MSSPAKNTATLLISCPDQKGVVAGISDFLYRHGANIVHADQHQDAEVGLFLMRVEWDLEGFDLPLGEDQREFGYTFSALAKRFQMDWKLKLSETRRKVAILVSRYDHCLTDLLYRYRSAELHCEIPLIISNHPEGRRWAELYGIPFHQVSVSPENKAEAEQEVLSLLRENQVDLVVLARYMQILSPEFVKEYQDRVINIHHSFLPAFLGAKPYHRAYERGVKLIGATSHYVTESLDDGPIIEQDVTRISHRDTVKDLIQKGRDLERLVLSRAVRWHLENRVLIYQNRTVVFS